MRITKAEPRGPALTVYESNITELTVLKPLCSKGMSYQDYQWILIDVEFSAFFDFIRQISSSPLDRKSVV